MDMAMSVCANLGQSCAVSPCCTGQGSCNDSAGNACAGQADCTCQTIAIP